MDFKSWSQVRWWAEMNSHRNPSLSFFSFSKWLSHKIWTHTASPLPYGFLSAWEKFCVSASESDGCVPDARRCLAGRCMPPSRRGREGRSGDRAMDWRGFFFLFSLSLCSFGFSFCFLSSHFVSSSFFVFSFFLASFFPSFLLFCPFP